MAIAAQPVPQMQYSGLIEQIVSFTQCEIAEFIFYRFSYLRTFGWAIALVECSFYRYERN